MDILANEVNNFRQFRGGGEFSEFLLYWTLCTFKTVAAHLPSKDMNEKVFFFRVQT